MNTKPALRVWVAGMLVWMLSQVGHAQSCSNADPLCGPASLLALCQTLGVETDLQELEELTGFDNETGTTMSGLRRAAEVKGLHAVGMKIGIDELVSNKALAIAYLWGNHFVAVECDDSEGIKVTGSSGKPVVAPKQEFAKFYSGFALLVAKDESSFPKAEVKGPDLRADAYNYDFGFIEQGEQAGHVFTLENKGVEDLVLSKVETSCTCTQAFLPKEATIPPGGKGELVVGFDSTGRQGGQSQIVYIHSNDSVSPVVQLRVGGVIKPIRLPVSVSKLYLGTVKTREGVTSEFLVQDPGDNSLTVSEVTSDSPFVKATLTRDDKQGLTYVVKAELQPGTPIGEFKSKLTVRSNHPKEPVVEIPVQAEVIGDIEVFPNQFFLGLLKKGQTVSKTTTLSTTAKERLKIKKIDSPADYIEVKSKPEGAKYTITANPEGHGTPRPDQRRSSHPHQQLRPAGDQSPPLCPRRGMNPHPSPRFFNP